MAVLMASSIKTLKGYVLDPIIHDDACWGGWVVPDADEIVRIMSKATILATGGGAVIFHQMF